MTIVCRRCLKATQRTGMNQRYCPDCARIVQLARKKSKKDLLPKLPADRIKAEANVCLHCGLPDCIGASAPFCPLRIWKKQKGAQL